LRKTHTALSIVLYPNFRVCQIAGGLEEPVFFRWVGAEEAVIAFAQIKPATPQTSLICELRLISQLFQDRLILISPDLFEGFLSDAAKRVISPKLVWMDVAGPIDAGDTISDAIAAVGKKESLRLVDFLSLLLHFDKQIWAVGVVADGENLIDKILANKLFGLLENGIDDAAGLFWREGFTFDFGGPAGPYEMIKAETPYVIIRADIEYFRHL
jgi:hypothetical protein